MQPSSNYTLLHPASLCWADVIQSKPLPPFADSVIEYLNALSVSLLHDVNSRLYPDVVTFAFFCRKANLLKLKEQYVRPDAIRLGRGIVFHIAPSNVPINFGYSLVAGLLSGNVNIVRVSSKQFPQVDLVVRHCLKIASEHSAVSDRIILVRYDHASDANVWFSSICNARVIWGGDTTIETIRTNKIPSRTFDVCFADRYSIAVINPDAILRASDDEMKRLGEAFYNDTYFFDQNACSAPHLIFWKKSADVEKSKSRFWDAVYGYADQKYQLQPVLAVDKLTTFYRQSVCMDSHRVPTMDNLIVRTQIDRVPMNIDSFRCAGGYFTECDIDALDEIAPIVTTKYQTLAYYGISKDELISFILDNQLSGLDRIVPIGKTTEFSLTWDGQNLIDTLSREVSIK